MDGCDTLDRPSSSRKSIRQRSAICGTDSRATAFSVVGRSRTGAHRPCLGEERQSKPFLLSLCEQSGVFDRHAHLARNGVRTSRSSELNRLDRSRVSSWRIPIG